MSKMVKGRRPTYGPLRMGGVVLLSVVMTIVVMLLTYQALEWISPRHTSQEPPPDAEAMDQQVLPSVHYNARNEIRENLRRLEKQPGQAGVVARESLDDRKVALTIDGMLDDVTMERLLEILERYHIKATFFVSGMQAAEEPGVVKAIAAAGYPIGNYTLSARQHMDELTQNELVEDFTCAGKILTEITGKAPTRLKCDVTDYTEPLLEAAQACGLSEAVRSTVYLTYHSFRSYDDAWAYVSKLDYQSIVSVKLSGMLDDSEYVPRTTALPSPTAEGVTPAPTHSATQEPMTQEARLLRMVEWLAKAIDETKFSAQMETLRLNNQGRLAEPTTTLYTTEPAVAYTFYGLGRVDEVHGVLSSLQAVGGVGTFFVTPQEIDAYPEQITRLIAAEQSIGVALFPKAGDDFYIACYAMLRAQQQLEQYGYHGLRLVMQPWGQPTEAVREAASAMGLMVVTYDVSLVREDNRTARNAQDVIDTVFRQATYGFRRGSVICMRMNYFDRSGLLGELITALQGTRNAYAIRDVYVLQSAKDGCYTYPLPDGAILPAVQGRIHAGQLTGDVMAMAQTRYIGNRDVSTRQQLPDFTQQEIAKLDMTGRIDNDRRAVFLTFDDWGSDVGLTKLLGVLEKHGVKATFFVRTEYVPDNPSLLRAIAKAGHEVASHTRTHMPLAHDPQGTWRFTPLTLQESLALRADLIQSYDTLAHIVGDIQLENGAPALTTVFRPPTMAISRIGMSTVFDCGFSYVVNGSYTSRDYMATSAQKLARELRANIRSGSVVILHMSDNSVHTADALDILLTENAQLPPEKAFTFARLSDYLGQQAAEDTAQ